MSVRVVHGDMLQVLGAMVAEGKIVHAIVTDPPYHLTSIVKRFASADPDKEKFAAANQTRAYKSLSTGFMGKAWDGGDIAFRSGTWRLCWELLPPGGHLLAFSGTRTYHRMATAIEEAGFEIRDMVAWLYGSGFPKSHNVSKALDKMVGAEREVVGNYEVTRDWSRKRSESGDGAFSDRTGGGTTPSTTATIPITAPATDAARQWEGWGTALKPALEPICLARKPLDGTVAANVLAHGTGALNIDGCRIETDEDRRRNAAGGDNGLIGSGTFKIRERRADEQPMTAGRWPANVCHDGSEEVVRAFPESGGAAAPVKGSEPSAPATNVYGTYRRKPSELPRLDTGSAARFFYSAKADADDRLGSKHPTVKPVDLMRWLVRLVTPPGGTVLDPFAGSGTTGMACLAEGIDCILIEREAEYVADIHRRISHVRGDDTPLFSIPIEAS